MHDRIHVHYLDARLVAHHCDEWFESAVDRLDARGLKDEWLSLPDAFDQHHHVSKPPLWTNVKRLQQAPAFSV
jgi:hypothetical protein